MTPAVVCVHCSASSSRQWRPLVQRLAGRRRVLAVDLYGYGASPPWPDGRRLTLLDEAGLLGPLYEAAGGPVDLVGHSYGGAVALRAALSDPGRVRSLVLFEPVLFSVLMAEDPDQPAAREIRAVSDDARAAAARGDLAGAAERFIAYWMGPGAWSGTPEPRRVAVADAMPKVLAEFGAVFAEPTPLADFGRIAVPTLYVTGTGTTAAAKGVARLLAKTLPMVTVVEVDGADHMGPVTRPDVFNALIEAHLDGLAPR